MVLLTAYQSTKNPGYRDAAQLAADYLRAMQQTASNNPALRRHHLGGDPLLRPRLRPRYLGGGRDLLLSLQGHRR